MGKGQAIIEVVVAAIIGIIGIYIISVLVTTLAPTNNLFSLLIFGGVLGAIIGAIVLAIKAAGH